MTEDLPDIPTARDDDTAPSRRRSSPLKTQAGSRAAFSGEPIQ
jgi:hypothetical protein